MPTRAVRQCTASGCGQPSSGGRCADHRQVDPRPPDRWRYNTTKWRRIRAQFLKLNPHCEDCGTQSEVPDHVPDRAVLVARGEPHPDAHRWLHPVCVTCHNRRTRTRQIAKGGG